MYSINHLGNRKCRKDLELISSDLFSRQLHEHHLKLNIMLIARYCPKQLITSGIFQPTLSGKGQNSSRCSADKAEHLDKRDDSK